MEDLKAGVPRTGYRGVVILRVGGRKVQMAGGLTGVCSRRDGLRGHVTFGSQLAWVGWWWDMAVLWQHDREGCGLELVG
jgi:hypothetical protein